MVKQVMTIIGGQMLIAVVIGWLMLLFRTHQQQYLIIRLHCKLYKFQRSQLRQPFICPFSILK